MKFLRLDFQGNLRFPFTNEQYFSTFPHTSSGYSGLEETPGYVLNELGVFLVTETDPPSADFDEIVEVGAPEYVEDGGYWQETWVTRPATEEELLAKQQLLKSKITGQVQKRLDDFAKTRDYDGILSAITYATSTNPKFAAEAAYCLSARDATWTKMYELLDEVLAGTRPIPLSIEDIESELPVLVWPE